MRIAVEEWELYNNGILLCKWFDTEIDSIESIEKHVAKVKAEYLMNTDDLEMFVSDFEGNTLGLLGGEESVLYAFEIAKKIETLDENEIIAITLLLEADIVNDFDEAMNLKDDIHSTGESKMEDIAYNYVNDCGLLENMPESLQGYFNYEALGRDMEINGTYLEDQNGNFWEYVS